MTPTGEQTPHVGLYLCFVDDDPVVAYPVLPAARSPSGAQAVVFCRYCDRPHHHSPEDGHRVAHCSVADSPYRDTGYVLVVVPGLTPGELVPPRSQRRRPRHPTPRDREYRHRWSAKIPLRPAEPGEPRAGGA